MASAVVMFPSLAKNESTTTTATTQTSSSSEPNKRSVRFANHLHPVVIESENAVGVTEEDEDKWMHMTDSSQRSMGSGGSSSSRSLHGGANLQSNLMRQQIDKDPLFYYEILNIVGCGSMGSVSMVRKREEVVGGSARQELVETLKRQRQREICWNIPVLGNLFRVCWKPPKNHHSSMRVHNKNLFQPTIDSTRSANSTYTTASSGASIGSQKCSEIIHAMKTIHLNRIKDKMFVQELQNEIDILRTLDHPNIVRIHEMYSHRNQIFVIMDMCSGGDLYTRDPYTEDQAARITSSILSAIAYMHRKNIAHRDLKFENVLFANNSPQAEIKLIDFGLSTKFREDNNHVLSDGVGTIYTMAPEVFKGSYTEKADLWSIGVITFMLLSSRMPFYGRERRHIVEQIIACDYKFKGRRWNRVSDQAKDFVSDLLVLDPAERASAEEALGNVWLNRRYRATVRNPNLMEVSQANRSIEAFAGYSKLKKLALMLIAHKSTAEDIGFLRKLFHEYDTDNSGALDFEEFKQAMSSFGYSDEEVEIMFDAADLDGTGMIAYTEFLAATIEAQGSISEERLAEAFDRLDSNDSGYIEPENLVEMLGDDFPREEIEAIIKEADLTHDNRISYAEFLALWENKEDSMNALDVVDRANFIQHKHSSGRKSIMYQDIKTDLDAFIRQESPGIFPQTLQADV